MSTSLEEGGRSLEANEDREVEDEEGRGLSVGEMSAEEVGVESVVAIRRRAASCSKAVVDIAEMMERCRCEDYRERARRGREDAGAESGLEDAQGSRVASRGRCTLE